VTWHQRAWGALSLLAIAALFACHFLEWAGYPAGRDEEQVVVPFHYYDTTTDCPVDASSSEYYKICVGGKSKLLMIDGLYARQGRSTELAFYFGALLPVSLVVGAGFILIRRKRAT
jgi:hypothetical protein